MGIAFILVFSVVAFAASYLAITAKRFVDGILEFNRESKMRQQGMVAAARANARKAVKHA